MSKLRIVWKKSDIGRPERQSRTIKALGFHKLNSVVIHEDTPHIRGMVRAVAHLVECSEVNE